MLLYAGTTVCSRHYGRDELPTLAPNTRSQHSLPTLASKQNNHIPSPSSPRVILVPISNCWSMPKQVEDGVQVVLLNAVAVVLVVSVMVT